MLYQKALDVPPSQFIIGSKKDDADDDGLMTMLSVQLSCKFGQWIRWLILVSLFSLEVLRGRISSCVKDGSCTSVADIKQNEGGIRLRRLHALVKHSFRSWKREMISICARIFQITSISTWR